MRPETSLRFERAITFSWLTITLLASSGMACWPEPRESSRTHVVLIVVDTLRTDRLGSYGASRDTSPSLDALAERSVRFERAYSAAPWTQPSVGSILTGLDPHRHRAPGALHGIAPEAATLAQMLNRRGFATGAVVSHHLLGRRYGFDRGFETFSDEEVGDAARLSTPGVTNRAIAWLEERARETRPFLLFVHYFDPHYPYRRHPEIGFAQPTGGRLDGSRSIGELRRLLPDMTSEEIAHLGDVYDEEVRYTDGGIGRLLEALQGLGLADHTIVIVTADHGEELGERGWLGHTRTLHEELVRVPLLIALPDSVDGRVVAEPVSLVSLTPTLLELLEIGAEGEPFDAPSLAPFLMGSRSEAEPTPPVYSSVDFVPLRGGEVVKEAHQSALVSGRYKLIRNDRSGEIVLYDLATDPFERTDIARREGRIVDRLLPVLEAHASDLPRRRPARVAPVDPAEIERLRALGYADDER